MTVPEQTTSIPPDLITLASAGMRELVAALTAAAAEPAAEDAAVPPRSVQIADFALAEAVRLIRLGTRPELVDAASAVTQMMISPAAKELKERHPEAHEVITAISRTLIEAISPASKGGELTVLRSWSGNAMKAVRLVNAAPGHAIARAELRRALGVEESYLSHLLADLEAAGLVERIRDGRSVTVHLGPSGRTEHVQDLLGEGGESDGDVETAQEAHSAEKAAFEGTLQRILGDIKSSKEPGAAGSALTDFSEQVSQFAARAVEGPDLTIGKVIVEGKEVGAPVTISATVRDGLGSERLEQSLFCRARIEDGELIEAEWWAPAGSWAPEPRRFEFDEVVRGTRETMRFKDAPSPGRLASFISAETGAYEKSEHMTTPPLDKNVAPSSHLSIRILSSGRIDVEDELKPHLVKLLTK